MLTAQDGYSPLQIRTGAPTHPCVKVSASVYNFNERIQQTYPFGHKGREKKHNASIFWSVCVFLASKPISRLIQ